MSRYEGMMIHDGNNWKWYVFDKHQGADQVNFTHTMPLLNDRHPVIWGAAGSETGAYTAMRNWIAAK